MYKMKIRDAEPNDAREILELVKSNFARLDPALNNVSYSSSDIAAFRHALEQPGYRGGVRRYVAAGRSGIEAYLTSGPWTYNEERPFSKLPAMALKSLSAFGWYRRETGLMLCVSEGNYVSRSVEQLVESSGVLTTAVPILNIPTPDDDSCMQGFLESIGAVETDQSTPVLVVRLGSDVQTRPFGATLWRRTRSSPQRV